MNTNIRKFETKLIPREESKLTMYGYNDWRITDFARSLKEPNLQYVVQPLVQIAEEQEGFTGLTAYVLSHDELLFNFTMHNED